MATAEERNVEIDGDYKSFQLQGSFSMILNQNDSTYRSAELTVEGFDETWCVGARRGDDNTRGVTVWLDRRHADTKLGVVFVHIEMELFIVCCSDGDWERESVKKIPKTERLVSKVCDTPVSKPVYRFTDDEWSTILFETLSMHADALQGFEIDFKIQITPLFYHLPLMDKVVQGWNTLFADQTYGDVSICVGEKEFKVYRGILSVRSPVFAAMFTSDMAEKKNNTVNIDDIKVEVVGEMLRYIYTGTIPEIEKFAGGLLVAAEKYQLEDLKDACSKYLAATITVENAVEILVLSHLNSCLKLKEEVLFFIKEHGNAVEATADWKVLMPKYPGLLMEVCHVLFERTLT